MKAKYLILPLAAIVLTTSIALAQEVESQEPLESTFSLFTNGDGFLGVYAEDISRENMGRYNLSQPRGVGVTRVVKDSPAEKAGLRKDDVILRIDGENVTSVRKLNRLVSEFAPDHSVKVTISRAGSEQELTATIGKRNNASMVGGLLSGEPKIWKWEGPLADREGDFSFVLGSSRRIGVSTIQLTKQLADYFGISGGKGVLVTSVSEDGPAAKAGVKAGDVITAVDSDQVDTVGDLSRIINRKKEGEVTLTIIRNKAQQTIRVLPKESGFSTGVWGPQVGRRIVIPRIEIPAIPEVNVSMPRIEIPVIPSINIDLPRVRVSPNYKVVKSLPRPI